MGVNMKKLVSLTMVVLLGLLFISNSTYAQSNQDIGQKIKLQFHKLLELTGDAFYGDGEALRVQEKKKLKDGDCDGTGGGNGDCTGFVDLNDDGVCDNCNRIVDLAKLKDRLRTRDRVNDGLGSMKRKNK
jgi:hypothetical protein